MDEHLEALEHGSETSSSTGQSEIDYQGLSNVLTTRAPKPQFRLGYWLAQNEQHVWQLVKSDDPDGSDQAVPRSGGVLNYLQYVYKKPAFRSNTVHLSTVVYGIAFIVFGNTAGNSIAFAQRVMEAANRPATTGAVRGLAIAVATFACCIHAFSRRGGIWLSNALAAIKIMMMLLIIITGICAFAGVFGQPTSASDNLAPSKSFDNAAADPYGHVEAFLAVIFAYSGFDQPTYKVLSEIRQPRKTFPWATSIAVGVVCTLYIAVNLVYMTVVPREAQINAQGKDVALYFFDTTLGTLSPDTKIAFGNIVVMTFTASRVKQELAKEGILPFPKFFGESKDLSFGRLLEWLDKKESVARALHKPLNWTWLRPDQHSQETPVGALVLHWVFCVVLILATYGQSSSDAYGTLVGVFVFVIDAIFGFLLAVGMLYLRFFKSEIWSTQPDGFVGLLSILAAAVFAIANLFPLVAGWIPPRGAFAPTTVVRTPWFTVPTIGVSTMAFGVLYWISFYVLVKRKEKREHAVFVVKKVPHFTTEPPGDLHGYPILTHETVSINWPGQENAQHDDHDIEMGSVLRNRAGTR
ncbi:hypothetical protein H2201_000993 [Coniosporium apollinis]|uniref:Amino acid permease/ SLC12A domain-containing protein n=1 Tax=Coniosporium apollinis TaxID=61459 RepID=A0ABQ9P5A7_9PEZI|nr:hypothetical protein H2201_000993 [Coniosporium apollinis]